MVNGKFLAVKLRKQKCLTKGYNMKAYFLAVLFLPLVLFANPRVQATDSPEESVKATIKKNIDSLINEDIDAYMATIHEKSPAFASTKNVLINLFKTYDLNVKIPKLEVIKITDTEAVVRCTQITTKVKGPAYRDNKSIAVHTLKKSNGVWKIFASKIEKTDFL